VSSSARLCKVRSTSRPLSYAGVEGWIPSLSTIFQETNLSGPDRRRPWPDARQPARCPGVASCGDVVWNTRTKVARRSTRRRIGRKPGRGVAATHARARGPRADRVLSRTPRNGLSNRFGSRRRMAVFAPYRLRSRPRPWSATACRHDCSHVSRPPATHSSGGQSSWPSRPEGQLANHCMVCDGHSRRGFPAHADRTTGRPVHSPAGEFGEQRVERRGEGARHRPPARGAARRLPAPRWWYRGRQRESTVEHRCAPFPRRHRRARCAIRSAGG
jgi:hypothetical protein